MSTTKFEHDAKSETEHDPKAETAHVEHLVSAYDGLSRGEAIKKFPRRFVVGLLVSVAAMYLGFTLTIPGAVTANQGFINQFGTKYNDKGELALDANHVGAWNGVNFGSQVLFQGLSPITAQRFGLKFNLYALTAFVLLAIVLEIVAKNWVVYLVAKIVCGFAAGFIGTSVTAYMSETTTRQFRGIHLACFSFAWALGGFFSSIGMEILQKTTPLKYKNAFYSEFVIVGVWIPVLLFLPESPVWYCRNGRHEEAMASLRRLNGKLDWYDEAHEYAVFRQDVEESEALAAKASKHSWLACFKGTNLRRTLISTIPFSMQTIGMSNAFEANVIVSCVLLFGVLCSFYLVDKAGRRPLLIMGGIVMCVCNLIVGGMGVIGVNSSTGSAMIAMMAIWVLAYALSCGPIGWLSLVENSTPVLRTQTAGIAAILQSLNGVIFNYCVPLMLSDQYAGWGAKTGFFFGPLAFLFTILVWFTVPETKGRSYAELDELYEKRIPAWRFKETKTASEEAAALEGEGPEQK
ncbi:hypothetical protein Q8F55_001224 [Vanrija albida]|uniref:Major facilitator superfamily (MFS) profile domain-containing protein n=1 Tax=Vanrija albida TaxID=181172 RepID=A0ABR3QFL7_9TREE